MITIVVLEDELKVSKVLSEALARQGYAVLNEPQTGGTIKIVKRSHGNAGPSGNGFANLADIFIKNKEGEIYESLLAEVEKPLIEIALQKTDGNQLKAAKILGINRNTLRAKMKKLGIKASSWKV